MKMLIKNIKYQLFIQTAKTPNPNTLKFLPVSKVVLPNTTSVDIPSIEVAIKTSPLARRLFKVQGVNRVFYGPNYISIGKQEKIDWTQIKPILFGLIEEHFESKQQLLLDQNKPDDYGINNQDSDVVKIIKEVLATRVRPTVQDDGGDVHFCSFDLQTGVLKLKMLGSCAGCPSSSQTLKKGIFKMMKHYVGEVNDVVAEDNK